MVDPIADDIDHQTLLTVADIRASDRARTKSIAEKAWLDRLFRHFPEVANRTVYIQVDWPDRSPNTAIIMLDDGERYLYTSDPSYDHGSLERI